MTVVVQKTNGVSEPQKRRRMVDAWKEWFDDSLLNSVLAITSLQVHA